MRVLGIAGSPRRGGNTALLLDEVMGGAVSRGAEVETIVLNDLKGRFGPLYIDADDPMTEIKDGAVEGDSVRFTLATAQGDTVPLYPAKLRICCMSTRG